MGSHEEIKIENDFILIRFQNDGNENFQIKRLIHRKIIKMFGIKLLSQKIKSLVH